MMFGPYFKKVNKVLWNHFNISLEACSFFFFNASSNSGLANYLTVEFPPLLPLLDLVGTSQTSNVILMLGRGGLV